MPYDSYNGRIIAPVSIDDVKQALGESSNDLATLCNSDGIIPWSKYKPIAYSQPFTDIPPVREDRKIDVTSYNGAPCIVRCGLLVPEIKYDVNTFNTIFDIAERLETDNTWGNILSSTYNVYHLHGGTSEPYRLGDFRNYSIYASKSFAINTPKKTTHKIYNVERTMIVILYKDMTVEGECVSLEDMFQDLYETWSLYLCVRYGTDKNVSLIKVSDVNKDEIYVYAKGDVVFDNDDVYMVPCLIYDRYDADINQYGKIVILDSPGRILWEYKPRVINIYKVKSGQDWEDMDTAIDINNNEIMLIVDISKTSSSSKTFANGQFRCTAHYINDTKTVVSYGDITNSIGQKIDVFTVPAGNENEKVQCYLKFTGVHENPKIGTSIYFDFEWYDDDTYKWNRINGYCYGIVRN